MHGDIVQVSGVTGSTSCALPASGFEGAVTSKVSAVVVPQFSEIRHLTFHIGETVAQIAARLGIPFCDLEAGFFYKAVCIVPSFLFAVGQYNGQAHRNGLLFSSAWFAETKS